MSLAAIVTIAVLVGAVVRDWGDAHDDLAAETERAAAGRVARARAPAAPATETLLADVDASNPPETRIAALRSLAGHADLGKRAGARHQCGDRRLGPRKPAGRSACRAGRPGRTAGPTESPLSRSCGPPSRYRRVRPHAALGAVDQIGPGAADLLPSVLRSLEEPAPDEIGAAALALSALGRTARQHTEQLARLMGHEARGEVGSPCRHSPRAAREAGDRALRTALESSDPWVRYHAASALLGEPEDLMSDGDPSLRPRRT